MICEFVSQSHHCIWQIRRNFISIAKTNIKKLIKNLITLSIVSVGGDGLFSEIFTALLTRTQIENDVNINMKDAKLCTPTITIGIIPSGKTNN